MRTGDPLKRFPPRYPSHCLTNARKVEFVSVTYDVTIEGRTENIESVYSSHECLTKEALRSVKKWRYKPRTINGHDYPRAGVYAEITFELVDWEHGETIRREIRRELLGVAVTLMRKLDPRICLEKIAMIERKFSDDFLDDEKATLLRYRGAAKIDALDYQGALDDLKASRTLEKDNDTIASLETAIAEIENALAAPKGLEKEDAVESDGRETRLANKCF